MQERVNIVGMIEKDVESVMEKVGQGQEIDRFCDLKKYNRADLISLALLKYSLNVKPEIREVAMKGLIEFDRNRDEGTIERRAVDAALFTMEDNYQKPARAAVKFLQGYVCKKEFSSQIEEVFNRKGALVLVGLAENSEF